MKIRTWLASIALLDASALAQDKATIAVGEIGYKAMDSSEVIKPRARGGTHPR